MNTQRVKADNSLLLYLQMKKYCANPQMQSLRDGQIFSHKCKEKRIPHDKHLLAHTLSTENWGGRHRKICLSLCRCNMTSLFSSNWKWMSLSSYFVILAYILNPSFCTHTHLIIIIFLTNTGIQNKDHEKQLYLSPLLGTLDHRWHKHAQTKQKLTAVSFSWIKQ